jgi:hypothetical protein
MPAHLLTHQFKVSPRSSTSGSAITKKTLINTNDKIAEFSTGNSIRRQFGHLDSASNCSVMTDLGINPSFTNLQLLQPSALR